MREYLSNMFSSPLMITGQIVGLFAVISVIICFIQKDRQKILLWQIIMTSLWTLHFILLGVWTGAASNGIMIIRSIIFYFKGNKKWAQHNVWFWIFIVIAILIGIVTWNGPVSMLPVAGTIFSTVSMWMKKPFHIRILTLPVSACWIIYNAISFSLAGIINEAIAIITIIVAIIKIDLKKKENDVVANDD